MPDEIAEMRDRFLTAVMNTASAEDAQEAAAAAMQAAEDALGAADAELDKATRAEIAIHAAYVAALRAHGYVDTATGPVPAPGRCCTCGHDDSEHDEDGEHPCEARFGLAVVAGNRCACQAFSAVTK